MDGLLRWEVAGVRKVVFLYVFIERRQSSARFPSGLSLTYQSVTFKIKRPVYPELPNPFFSIK